MADDAMEKVTGIIAERTEDYGDFNDAAEAASAVRRAIEDNWQGEKLPPTLEESIHMIANKLGRLAAGNHLHADSWRDIACLLYTSPSPRD